MTKTIFLIPPSEGKTPGGYHKKEETYFNIKKTCKIAISASEKDLKCTGKRFEEAKILNKTLCNGEQNKFLQAIERYSGVMYKYIDYKNIKNKDFFDENFYILSGMYGILKAKDIIGNYKLPIETKGLYQYFWNIIPEELISLKPDYIVNLLPISYAKLIGEGTNCSKHKKKKEVLLNVGIQIINVNFYKKNGQKVSHGVKKIKGEWIKNICNNKITDYKQFGGEIINNEDNTIEVRIEV